MSSRSRSRSRSPNCNNKTKLHGKQQSPTKEKIDSPIKKQKNSPQKQNSQEKQDQYILNLKANINGTSLKGDIWVSPLKLIEVFGQPGDGDDYKTTGQFYFQDSQNEKLVFTIYDWKATSLFWGEGDGPEEFWKSKEQQVFNIGGHDKEEAKKFIKWLEDKLGVESQ